MERPERIRPVAEGGRWVIWCSLRSVEHGQGVRDQERSLLRYLELLEQENPASQAQYVGVEFDLVMTKDAWGMLSEIWVLGEIGVEGKRCNFTIRMKFCCQVEEGWLCYGVDE